MITEGMAHSGELMPFGENRLHHKGRELVSSRGSKPDLSLKREDENTLYKRAIRGSEEREGQRKTEKWTLDEMEKRTFRS